MPELNPYEPPAIPATPDDSLRAELIRSGGCWRQQKAAVTTHNGRLPPRCVKTGEPATRFQTVRLTWYPWWVLPLAILLGPLFFIPLIKAGRRVRVSVGTGATWKRQRYRTLPLLPVMLLIAGFLATFIYSDQLSENAERFLVFVAILCVVIGVMPFLQFFAPPLVAGRVDAHFVWLTGADERFLETLPQWPLKD